MPTPVDVLMDREKYPDDLEFDWMGEKHTLKTWRTQILPMGEFTKVRQAATDKIRELEGTQLTLQQQLAAALQNQKAAGTPVDDGDDPYIAPLRAEMRTLNQAIADLRKERDAERNQAQLDRWWSQIEDLRKDNPELDREGLIRYASAKGMRDLKDAHRLMSYDTDVKAAETRGYERGKKTAPPAYVPGGRRGSATSAIITPPTAKTTQEAMVNALNDPDVLAALHGETEG